MQIGITGGSGFIGSYFIDRLIKNNTAVRILDIKPLENKYPEDMVDFLKGDVRDESATNRFCHGLDAVVHLAAAHHDFGVSRDEYFSVNQQGTRVLLDAAVTQNVNCIVFTSSVAVYDPKGIGISEETTPAPQNDYGQSKLAAEDEIRTWIAGNPSRKAIIIRPTVVFGPRNRANMYNLISQIYKGRYLFNFGDGVNIKSLAYVENLVEFVLHLLGNGIDALGNSELYNYVDYPQLSVRETIRIIHNALGRKLPRITVPLGGVLAIGKLFDLAIAISGKNLPISSKRIKKIATATKFEAINIQQTSFKPGVSLENGLRKMIAWFLEEERKNKNR